MRIWWLVRLSAHSPDPEATPLRIPVQVCACAGGDVYAWGANVHGQLGIGTCSAYRSEPCEVIGGLSGAGVMAISCGLFHSAAVTDGGLLFTVRGGSQSG
jgi:alpha-tubulin suppressor-like RCC1 family protein